MKYVMRFELSDFDMMNFNKYIQQIRAKIEANGLQLIGYQTDKAHNALNVLVSDLLQHQEDEEKTEIRKI